MDPERACKAITDMLPMLSGYPDAAFTPNSVQDVCSSGRILADGSRAAMTRVPTFGELDAALGVHWRKRRELAAPVLRPLLPAPMAEEVTAESMEHVRSVVSAFEAERSWNRTDARDDTVPVKPRHLNDAQLLAVYEQAAAENLPGAAMRVAILRKRLAEKVT